MLVSKKLLKITGLNIVLVGYYLLIVHSFYFFDFHQDIHRFIFPLFLIPVFIAVVFLKNKVKEIKHSWYLFCLILVIQLFLPRTKESIIIIYVVFIPLTFFIGYLNKLKVLKLGYPLIIILVGIYGFINLLYYMANFNAQQNITSPKIIVKNEDGKQIRIDTIKNKIIVLDFWSTSCGICFKQFPEFEKIYLKYKNNPKVNLYTLNIPFVRDTLGYAQKKIGKYSYKFPKLYANSDTIPKLLNFNGYPRLVILKNHKIRFNGHFISSSDKNVFVKKLENEIELLLQENK